MSFQQKKKKIGKLVTGAKLHKTIETLYCVTSHTFSSQKRRILLSSQNVEIGLLSGSFESRTGLGPVVQRVDNAIQWISVNKANCPIHWIVIYPVDNALHLF